MKESEMKVRDMCNEHDEIFTFKTHKKLDNLQSESVEFWNPKRQVGLDVGAGR